MRILNDEADEKLDRITVYLTTDEALQLRGYLNQLLDNPKLHHSHLSSADFQKEITVCVYQEDNLSRLDERSKRLILNDE